MTTLSTTAPDTSKQALCKRLVKNLAETMGAGRDSDDQPVILQTHLSWVILAGDSAWKIKKPVRFDFVDFSTLENRRRACKQELSLNRQYSPSIYLDFVPIYGNVDAPELAPAARSEHRSDVIEYAVHMRRFSQQTIFSHLIAKDRLDEPLIDALADQIASFHQAASCSSIDDLAHEPATNAIPASAGSFALIRDQIRQVLDGVGEDLQDQRLARIRHSLTSRLDCDRTRLENRKATGFVRECHADLHLSNICLHESKVAVFDCLEFDPLLRVIDVMADLAFVIADLQAWRRNDLANRLLNRYLSITGDYAGLAVLPLYIAYRALVRARVRLLSKAADQEPPLVPDYLFVADAATTPVTPSLIILRGLSGSGKSWIGEKLCARCGLIRIRSDVERKRLLGLSSLASTRQLSGPDAYGAAHTADTYARLSVIATQVIDAGHSVIVDASFLRRADREKFAALATSLGIEFHIIEVYADESIIRQRLRSRQAAGTDPSEADETVFDSQRQLQEPLTDEERGFSIAFDNSENRTPQAMESALAPIVDRLLRTTSSP